MSCFVQLISELNALMNKFWFACILPIVCATSVSQAVPQGEPNTVAESVPGPHFYQTRFLDAHQTLWERVQFHTNRTDGETFTATNHYIELANGGNYFDQAGGKWLKSRAEFEITADGAVAKTTSHKVQLKSDLWQTGAITVTTPDGKILSSTPICLEFSDGDKAVRIGQVKSSIGQLVASNVVIYPDCFSNLKADLRVVLSASGVEVDVVLKEQLPFTPEDFQLDPSKTRLNVLTEFFNPPNPLIRQSVKNGGPNQSISPPDITLQFGKMVMAHGQAFLTENELVPESRKTNHLHFESVPVSKSWEKIAERDILIESSPWSKIRHKTKELPPSSAQPQLPGSGAPSTLDVGSVKNRRLPTLATIGRASSNKMLVAKGPAKAAVPGLVLDYTLLYSQEGYEFLANETYYVSEPVSVEGDPVVFHGGTVIKYAEGASIEVGGDSVTMKTQPYLPITFTSMNDDSVGEVIAGSTGVPDNDRFANPALATYDGAVGFRDVRIAYAQQGISFDGRYAPNGEHLLRNAQFFRCSNPVYVSYGTLKAQNILACESGDYVLFDGYEFNVEGWHLTMDGGYILALDSAEENPGTFAAFNSIFNVGEVCMPNNIVASSWGGSFQQVGFGGRYLGNDAYRDCGTFWDYEGTAVMPTDLWAEFQKKTTFPPTCLTGDIYNQINSSTITLGKQVACDHGFPDLGYHYDPVDWLATNLIVHQGVTLILTNGATMAIGFGSASSGITLQSNAKLISEGSPTNLNHIVWCQGVQELPVVRPVSASSFGQTGSSSKVRARFTEFPMLTGAAHFDIENSYNPTFEFQDCQFAGGSMKARGALGLGFTNCLAESLKIDLIPGSAIINSLFRNSLFVGGEVALNNNNANSTFTVRNCLLDHVNNITTTTYPISSSYNAYIQTTPFPNTLGSQILSGMSYCAGPLGKYYLPELLDGLPNPLFSQDQSRTPASDGLYHYTSTTDQDEEGSTFLDTGFHYIVVNSTTLALKDSDSDGLPDYIEDANGNGVKDTSETSFTGLNADDTDNDQMSDYLESLIGRNPRVNGAVLENNNQINLRVYTPMN